MSTNFEEMRRALAETAQRYRQAIQQTWLGVDGVNEEPVQKKPHITAEEEEYWPWFVHDIMTRPPEKRPLQGHEVAHFKEIWLPRTKEKVAKWRTEWEAEYGPIDTTSFEARQEASADWQRYLAAKRAKEDASRKKYDWLLRAQQWEEKHPHFAFLSPLMARFGVGAEEAEQRAKDIERELRKGTTTDAVLGPARRGLGLVSHMLSGIGSLAQAVPEAVFSSKPGEKLQARQMLREFATGLPDEWLRAIGHLYTGATEHPELFLHDPVRMAFDVAAFVPVATKASFGAKAGQALAARGAPTAGKVVSAALYPIDMFLPTERNIAATLAVKVPKGVVKGGIKGYRWGMTKVGQKHRLSPEWFWSRPSAVMDEVTRRVQDAADEFERLVKEAGEGIDEKALERLWKNPRGGTHEIELSVVGADGKPLPSITYRLDIGEGGRLNPVQVETAYAALMEARDVAGKFTATTRSHVLAPEGLEVNVPTQIVADRVSAYLLEKAFRVGLDINASPPAMAMAVKYMPHTKLFTPGLFKRAMGIKAGRYTPEELAGIQEAALTKKRQAGWEQREAEGRYLELGIREQLEAQVLELAGTLSVFDTLGKELRRAVGEGVRGVTTGKLRPINLDILTPDARRFIVEHLGEVPAAVSKFRLSDLSAQAQGVIVGHLQNQAWALALLTASGNIKAIRAKYHRLVRQWEREIAPLTTAAFEVGRKQGLTSIERIEALATGSASIRSLVDKAVAGLDTVTSIQETLIRIAERVRGRPTKQAILLAIDDMPDAIKASQGALDEIAFAAKMMESLAKDTGVRAFADLSTKLKTFVDDAKKVVESSASLLKDRLAKPKIPLDTEISLTDLPPGLRAAVRPSLVDKAAARSVTATAVPEELANTIESLFYKNQPLGWQRWVTGSMGQNIDLLHNTFVRTVLFSPMIGLGNKTLVLNFLSAMFFLVPLATLQHRLFGLLSEWPRVMLEYMRPRKVKGVGWTEKVTTPGGGTVYKVKKPTSIALAADPDAIVDVGRFGKMKREKIWRLLETGREEGGGLLAAAGLFEKIPGLRQVTQRWFATGEASYLTGFLSDATFKEAMFRALGKSNRAIDLDEAVSLVKDAFGAFSRVPMGVRQLSGTLLPFLTWTYYAYPKMADLLSSYIHLAVFYRGIGNALEQGYATVSNVDLEKLRREYPTWLSVMTYMGKDPKRRGHRWVDMSRGGIRNLVFDAWQTFLRESSSSLAEGAARAMATQTWWGIVPVGIAVSALSGEPENPKTGQIVFKPSDPPWYKASKILLETTMPLYAPGEVQRLIQWLETRYGPEILKREVPMRRMAEHTFGEIMRGFVMRAPAVYRPGELRIRAHDLMKSRMGETKRVEARRKAAQAFEQQYWPGEGVSRPGLVPIEKFSEEMRQ